LQGLRVIELASIGPGPLCCMLLADLGADVVRVDRLEPSGLGLAMPPQFDVNGRNRRSVALDLKSPAGVAAVLRLLQGADLLVEGFRPGVAEKLGLGPAECHAVNPALVYGRMTGFGQTGPLAAAGHDLNYIALSGVLHAIGNGRRQASAAAEPGGRLRRRCAVPGAGRAGCVVGTPALRPGPGGGRGHGGRRGVAGVHLLRPAGHGRLGPAAWRQPAGRRRAVLRQLRNGRRPPHQLAALEPKFFAQLAQALGLDARFVPRQHDRACGPKCAWPSPPPCASTVATNGARRLEGSDVCFAPVLSFEEAPQHAHAPARGAFVSVAGVVQPAPGAAF
jgi:alpha-methylacyl-CoA racemase